MKNVKKKKEKKKRKRRKRKRSVNSDLQALEDKNLKKI